MSKIQMKNEEYVWWVDPMVELEATM